MRYKLPKGTEIERRRKTMWESFTTTRDAYFDKGSLALSHNFHAYLVSLPESAEP